MVAAIYARKSTEQSGVADEDKSVARQIEHARTYAARKGWTVDDDHVYVRRRHLGRRVREAPWLHPADERAVPSPAVSGARHVRGVAPRP